MRIFGIEITRTKAATFAPREQKPLHVQPSRRNLFEFVYEPNLAYYTNPILRAILDFDSGMFANADVYEANAKGEKVENSKIITALKKQSKPSFNEFLRQVRKDVNLHGFYIAYILKNSGGVVQEIRNFNPYFTTIYVKQLGYAYEIDYVQTYIGGKSYRISGSQLDDIFIFWESEPDFTTSQLVFNPRIKTVKNIIESSDAFWQGLKNINKFRGAENIISPDSETDSMPNAPDLQKSISEAKLRLYSEYTRNFGYADNQSGLMIMDEPVRVQKLSSPLSEMEIGVQNEMFIDSICNVIGIDPVLFSKQGKFENYKQAQKSHYENNIQPFADAFFQEFSAYLLGAMSASLQIFGTYDYLDVFQEDLEKNRIVTEKTANIAIAMNTAVTSGQMNYDNAVETLIYGGVDLETAKKMIKR